MERLSTKSKVTKINLDWKKIYYFTIAFLIFLAAIVAVAIIWFCIGEVFPGLRRQLPYFFNVIDGILTVFDGIYKIFVR